MPHSLSRTATTHKDALDAIFRLDATDSDFAQIGEAIVPPQPGERPKPQVFYVLLAKKTIHMYVISLLCL